MSSPLSASRSRHHFGCAAALLALLGLAVATPASAQVVRLTTASAVIGSLGAVLGTSALSVGAREKTGDLNVHGTVTLRQNGPYLLQTRLTTPFTDKNKPSVINTVAVKVPSGQFVTLGTSTWVTVAQGPGTPSQTKPVHFFITWGKSSSKDPKHAVTIPVEYRVVPQ